MKLQPISVLRSRSLDLRRRCDTGGGEAVATSSATRLVMVSPEGKREMVGRPGNGCRGPAAQGGASVEADLVLDTVLGGLDRVVDVVGARHHRRVQIAQDALDRGS